MFVSKNQNFQGMKNSVPFSGVFLKRERLSDFILTLYYKHSIHVVKGEESQGNRIQEKK